MRQLDRIRRRVKTHRMDTWNRSGPGGRHVNRPVVPGRDHRVAQRQCRAGRRVSLGRMVRFVNPGPKRRVPLHDPGGFGHEHLKHVHADRKVCRRHHAQICALRLGSQRRFVVPPPSRANHHRQPTLEVVRKVLEQCLGRREVDGHVGRGRPVTPLHIDTTGNLEPVGRGQLVDEPTHPAVSDQQ